MFDDQGRWKGCRFLCHRLGVQPTQASVWQYLIQCQGTKRHETIHVGNAETVKALASEVGVPLNLTRF